VEIWVVVSAVTMRETDEFGSDDAATTQSNPADEMSIGNQLVLPEGYKPSNDEEFMNPRQLAYFRRKLIDWKESILREAASTLETLKAEPMREPDVNDRASSETDWGIELRTRDRQRKVISKIDAALRRIETGDYGYCEVTGEPISLARLDARPIATMTLEAQERHERDEKITRDE
jgi:DnaK suppressor protein